MASKARVLIVEDDGQARGMLREYLSSREPEVDETGDGDTMRARLAASLPDQEIATAGVRLLVRKPADPAELHAGLSRLLATGGNAA